MAKKEPTTARAAVPVAAEHVHVNITPEQTLHVHVVKDDEEIAHYIAQARGPGLARFTAAPEPAAPVQDPDPVSGT